MRRRDFIAATVASASLPRLARAADPRLLRIAVQTETSSIDPHFALIGANQVVANHIFDPLVGSDLDMRPAPGLTEVSNPQPDVWEFRVRDGATFHDGSKVTAAALRLARYDAWWGGRPDFAEAIIRPVSNDAARLAALLAGDADLIDHVPQADLPRVRENKALAVTTSTSARVIYIGLDQAGDST